MSPVEKVGPIIARQELTKAMRGPSMLVGKRPPLETIIEEKIEGVCVRRYRPVNAKSGSIAFIHGGGWMLGSVEDYDIFAGTLAAYTCHEVVSVNYRLSPEHRYPAALSDCLNVVQELLKSGRVVVVGDSSGGNLVAAVTQTIKVTAQVLFYPVLDCANEHSSYKKFAKGHILTADTMRYFRREYVPQESQRFEPGVSPLLAVSISNCPATYICIAQCDVLRDECISYAERLASSGVDVTYEEVQGTVHGFVSFLGLREGREALRRASTWIVDKMEE
jgi:acetyl esterase